MPKDGKPNEPKKSVVLGGKESKAAGIRRIVNDGLNFSDLNTVVAQIKAATEKPQAVKKNDK